MGAQKNSLNVTVLLNTQNKCLNWWVGKKCNFRCTNDLYLNLWWVLHLEPSSAKFLKTRAGIKNWLNRFETFDTFRFWTKRNAREMLRIILRSCLTGDLFECSEDLEDYTLWQENSEQPEIQQQSRIDILRIADWIVPGHGSMFKVPEEYKRQMKVVMYYEYSSTKGAESESELSRMEEYVVCEDDDWRIFIYVSLPNILSWVHIMWAATCDFQQCGIFTSVVSG